MKFKITDVVREAASEALAELKAKPRPFGHLATGHSDAVVRKALYAMQAAGAPIEYDRPSNNWRLLGPWQPPPSLMTRADLERVAEMVRGPTGSCPCAGGR